MTSTATSKISKLDFQNEKLEKTNKQALFPREEGKREKQWKTLNPLGVVSILLLLLLFFRFAFLSKKKINLFPLFSS